MTSEELTLLGKLLWDGKCGWRSEWEEFLGTYRLSLLLYYFHAREMPANLAGDCLRVWQGQTVASMKFESVLIQLYGLLEKAGIDIIPLKGAYLAYYVYPNATLRPLGDIDILVRREQLSAFNELLEKNGWKTGLDVYSDHHAGMRQKNGIGLEPHFNLPNFPDGMEREIWKESVELKGNVYRFTPEMTLLMLCQHDSICQFQSTDLLKLLIDVTFVLKKYEVDWVRLGKLAKSFRLPNPALLVKAFPEFFPESIAAEISTNSEVTAAYRELLLHPRKFDSQQEIEAHSSRRWTGAWIKNHFRGFSTASICWKFHLKKHEYWKIQICRIKDAVNKLCIILGLKNRILSADLQEHLKRVSLVEEDWKSQGD